MGGDLAAVIDLHRDLAAMGMDAARDLSQAGDEAVVGDARLVRLAGARRPGNGRRSHDDETGSALSPGFVIGLGAFAAAAVVAAEVLSHGGHGDAVLQLHGADTSCLQQGCVGIVHFSRCLL